MANQYQPKTYRDSGGDRYTIASGGQLRIGDGVDSTALFIGGGTAVAPVSTATAGANFVTLYTQTTDATGADSRQIYGRHYLAGGSGSGETARFYTTVTAAGATAAHGAHVSVSFSGSGTLTGEAFPVRATLEVPNATLGGTAAGLESELFASGTSSAASNISFLRCVISGDATGAATLQTGTNILNVVGAGAAGVGKVFHATTAPATY